MAAMTMKGAYLKEAHLEGAKLIGVHLEGAKLWKTHLVGACLWEAHLEGAELWNAQLEGVGLIAAHLEGALLRDVILSDKRHIGPAVADIQWGSTNLGVADWTQVIILGDEIDAHQETDFFGQKKDAIQRLKGYQSAVRANRQLAVALRNQGLNEEADRFAYRAQLLQRKVWRLQNRPLKFLLSWFLYLLAGYGYRPLRSLIAYLVIIFGFMGLYLLNAHFVAPHLTWDEALVLSVSSFHGRGFFTQNVTLGDTYARLAAGEAIVGLFIEISFIATFTQRFFGK